MAKKLPFVPTGIVSLSNVVYSVLAEHGRPNLTRAEISVDPHKSLKTLGVTRISISRVLEKINEGCIATIFTLDEICHWDMKLSWGTNLMENITPAIILTDVEERYDTWLRNPGGA